MKTPLRVEFDQASHGECMCLTDTKNEVIARSPGNLKRDINALNHIALCVNNHERLVEALRGLMDAIGHIKTPATNDGLNLCDAKAKARAALKELTQ